MKLPALARSLTGAALATVRTGHGSVVWGGDHKMGFGNFGYLWLQADRLRRGGEPAWVRRLPGMDPWLTTFPALADLVIDERAIPFRAKRLVGDASEFGPHYSADDLETFISRRLASASLLSDRPADDPGEVVINVRRGDYYSVPEFRGNYGFDIAAYVRVAVAMAAEQAPITGFTVVSDGIDWCRLKLGWLETVAPTTFAPPADTPADNFRTLASARRLILANSTFSYWAGYTSNVLHEDNHREVIAPWFHARRFFDGRAYQLDPRWSVVETIPGGWDA